MKRPLLLLAAVVGLTCVLVWVLHRNDRREDAWSGVTLPQVATSPVASLSPAAPPPDAATAANDRSGNALGAALFAALQKALARRDVLPNETVLTFKDDAALARFLARAGKAGLTVLGQSDALRSVRVRFSDVSGLRDELAQNASDYTDASGNFVFNVPQVPVKEDRAAVNQVPFGNDALAFIGARGDRSQWGRGVTIAVIDTGVSIADPTFGTGRVNAIDVGLGTTPGKGGEDGHGTSVASLAGGAATDAPGVAPAAEILSLRVTDATGTSNIFTVAQAIVSAVDAGARVINVSLGGYGTNGALNAAIDYAVRSGAVIVAAAGNDQAAQLAWPAADPRVVSVGAVDKAEQQVTFSNSSPQLQLTAPGYGVQTAWLDGQRASVDGTSASAPLVSGSIAALMSQNPTLSPSDAVQLLTRTADDAGAPGADPAYGKGILNLGWAMNASNPTYVDTAVSSHYYDASANQMQFVVQNRSGQTISGAALAVTAGTSTTNYLLPTMQPGDTQVVKVPVDDIQLSRSGSLPYTTTLTNPAGVVDQVPRNNRRSSVLSAPKK